MVRVDAVATGLLFVAGLSYATCFKSLLPAPHYKPREGDPDWLQRAAQFHGHLGPWVIIGARAGLIGRQAVRAKGYFDVQVECQMPFETPPQTCMLDGLQVTTGATYGKRNLSLRKGERVCVTITNVQTKAAVRITLTDKLLSLVSPEKLGKGRVDHEKLERIARQIATMPAADAFVLEPLGP